jgi:hypothetical protein
LPIVWSALRIILSADTTMVSPDGVTTAATGAGSTVKVSMTVSTPGAEAWRMRGPVALASSGFAARL